MKTTVEISPALLREAKAAAERQGTTLRALLEEGLRRLLEEQRQQRRRKFRLRRAGFKGRGLQPGIADGSWRTIQALVYEGRGG